MSEFLEIQSEQSLEKWIENFLKCLLEYQEIIIFISGYSGFSAEI